MTADPVQIPPRPTPPPSINHNHHHAPLASTSSASRPQPPPPLATSKLNSQAQPFSFLQPDQLYSNNNNAPSPYHPPPPPHAYNGGGPNHAPPPSSSYSAYPVSHQYSNGAPPTTSYDQLSYGWSTAGPSSSSGTSMQGAWGGNRPTHHHLPSPPNNQAPAPQPYYPAPPRPPMGAGQQGHTGIYLPLPSNGPPLQTTSSAPPPASGFLLGAPFSPTRPFAPSSTSSSIVPLQQQVPPSPPTTLSTEPNNKLHRPTQSPVAPRSRRVRPPPPKDSPALSFGPNVRPPREFEQLVKDSRRSTVVKTARAVKDGQQQGEKTTTKDATALTTQPLRPSTPANTNKAGAVTKAEVEKEVASSTSTEGKLLSTPSRRPQDKQLDTASTTATVASSSPPSPILTPLSPATTATTALLSGPSSPTTTTPTTPAPAPVDQTTTTTKSTSSSVVASPNVVPTTTPSTPFQPAPPKKSWADLLRSPSTPSSTPSSPLPLAPTSAPPSSFPTSSTSLPILLSQASTNFTAPSSPGLIPRGLINNGNLCFANAILQVLVYCAPFWNLMELLREKLKQDLSGRLRSVEAMISFLQEFKAPPSLPLPSTSSSSTPSSEPFIPSQVYSSLHSNKRFDAMTRGQQEDAEEFLGFFLDTLHEELLGLLAREGEAEEKEGGGKGGEEEGEGWEEVGSKGRVAVTRTTESKESPITQIFGGQLRSVLRCQGQKDSITLEPYQRLQLDIQPPAVSSLSQALSSLLSPEPLPDYLSRSGTRIDATKQVYLETFPPVLILHLKRFLYDEVGGVQKSGKRVRFGERLEVEGSKGRVAKYGLFAVVYHHGQYASGGHYTVAVKPHPQTTPSSSSAGSTTGPASTTTAAGSSWLHIDDTNIKPIPVSEVFSSSSSSSSNGAWGMGGGGGEGETRDPYLLFWNRIDG